MTVNQWTSIARDLGGECAEVSTIISSTGTDPHEYEPTPADIQKVSSADLLIANGLGYDKWALDARDVSAKTVNIADFFGAQNGDNPHLWYNFNAIRAVSTRIDDAILAFFIGDSNEFRESEHDQRLISEQNARFGELLGRVNAYGDALASAKMGLGGKSFVASESVANYLAGSLGLEDKTPQGYANAMQNEAEPSPADLAEVLNLLKSGAVDYFIYNVQEADDLTKQLFESANLAGVKVINVTEQMPDAFTDLLEWQTSVVAQFTGA